MEDLKRHILARVASGKLTPEEAATELGELNASTGAAAPLVVPGRGQINRVRVLASMGSVTVVGDESVNEAVAEGPHQARRDGDTLVVESQQFEDGGIGFAFGSRLRFGFDPSDRGLRVRMNPALVLEAEIEAGTLRVSGIRAPIKAEVHAGSTRIEGFTCPIDLDVEAGSVKAFGRLTEGESHIRCQAGSVTVGLEPASSVRISARTSLGRISLPGEPRSTMVGGGGRQAQLGSGEGTLEIESELGSVQVEVV